MQTTDVGLVSEQIVVVLLFVGLFLTVVVLSGFVLFFCLFFLFFPHLLTSSAIKTMLVGASRRLVSI